MALKFLDPKADVTFKKIFGQHPDLIKSFLNNLLPLPEGRVIESVTYLTPEQSPRIPTMKNTIVDVKCTDQNGHIFIVEMQMTWSASFYQRFLYGASKAYVHQLDAGQAYSTLCPVYGIALINEIFEKGTPDWFHHYRFINTKDMDKTLEGLELVFLELPKFTPTTFDHRKIGALWLRFLRETGETLEAIPEDFKVSPEILKAMELAQESAYTKVELDLYDSYLDAIRVAKTIREDSYKEAKQEGERKLEQVKKESEKKLEQVKQETKREMARKALTMGMTVESVRDLTGLPLEVIQSLPR